MAAAEPKVPEEEPLPDDILNASADEIATRTRLLENDIKVMKSEQMRLSHEQSSMREKIKDNADKIKQNKVLPYLVGNVVEVSAVQGVMEAGSSLCGKHESQSDKRRAGRI